MTSHTQLINRLKKKIIYWISSIPLFLVIGIFIGYSIGVYDQKDEVIISDKVQGMIYTSPLTIPEPVIRMPMRFYKSYLTKNVYFYNHTDTSITIDSITVNDKKISNQIKLKPREEAYIKCVFNPITVGAYNIQVKFWINNDPTICWIRGNNVKRKNKYPLK